MLAAKKALHHVLYSLPLAAAQGFEIDTSDQMVIPSLWASSIGLHLINIFDRGSGDFLLFSHTVDRPATFLSCFELLRPARQFGGGRVALLGRLGSD